MRAIERREHCTTLRSAELHACLFLCLFLCLIFGLFHNKVDLLVMKSLLDKFNSVMLLKHRCQENLIERKRLELEDLGNKLAHDLARRNLQLEKAKKLHLLVQEVSNDRKLRDFPLLLNSVFRWINPKF